MKSTACAGERTLPRRGTGFQANVLGLPSRRWLKICDIQLNFFDRDLLRCLFPSVHSNTNHVVPEGYLPGVHLKTQPSVFNRGFAQKNPVDADLRLPLDPLLRRQVLARTKLLTR